MSACVRSPGSGVLESLLQLFVFPLAFVVVAVDEEGGGAVYAGSFTTFYVAFNPPGEALIRDGVEGFGGIEAELAGFGGEEFGGEARLVGEDGVVHGPVLRGLGCGGEL